MTRAHWTLAVAVFAIIVSAVIIARSQHPIPLTLLALVLIAAGITGRALIRR
jgi:tetrahydromethanopterin S-methyltransferase subunit E